MVPLSIMGMTGWVNPFFLVVRRPGTLSIARRRSTGAFFCGKSGSFDLWGLRRGGGGSRWSDAVCDAPGRHPRYTQDRTLWLQEPWVRRERCTPRPSTRWQTSWRCRSDHLLRIGRGTASEERATHDLSACMRVCAWKGGALGEARRQESAKNVSRAPLLLQACARARDVGSLSVHHYTSKKSDLGWVDMAMCHPAGAALFLWALQAHDGHGRGAPPRWLDARRHVTSVHAAVDRPSDGSSRQDLLRRRHPSMERQTRSPAASSALEAEIAVLSGQWLALALQVLLDEGAVLPGCLIEEKP